MISPDPHLIFCSRDKSHNVQSPFHQPRCFLEPISPARILLRALFKAAARARTMEPKQSGQNDHGIAPPPATVLPNPFGTKSAGGRWSSSTTTDFAKMSHLRHNNAAVSIGQIWLWRRKGKKLNRNLSTSYGQTTHLPITDAKQGGQTKLQFNQSMLTTRPFSL